MAEVIGVVASIVGIVAAAAKVAEYFGHSMPGLSSLQPNAKALSMEIISTSLVVDSLQKLILVPNLIPEARKDMIQIDHLVTLMTDGVQLFSEIEAMVKKLGQPNDAFRSRTRWGRKEKELGSLYRRLNTFKSNISIMLNVLQCTSDMDASRSLGDLRTAVDELLQSNQSLASRIASCERNSIISYDTASELSDRHSMSSELTVRQAGTALAVNDPSDASSTRTGSTIRQAPVRLDLSSQNRSGPEPPFSYVGRFAFEEDLQRSRPYLSATRASMDNSFRSSVARSHAWSSLSLSDVSLLSVIALPLTSSEISNSEHYSIANIESARQAITLELTSGAVENKLMPSGPPCILCTAASDTFFCDACNAGICCGCLQSRDQDTGLLGDSDADSGIGSVSLKTVSTASSDNTQQWHLQDEEATWLDVESDVLGNVFVIAYDRLASLWAEYGLAESQAPKLVSFIGPPCAGKSALIKLLIEHQDWEKELSRPWICPVTDHLQSGMPTTSGLRLYADPFTAKSCDPVIFVDSQGLDADGISPVAMSYQQILRPSGLLSVQACLARRFDPAVKDWVDLGTSVIKCRASKPCAIVAEASTGLSNTLNYVANELYPRLLTLVSKSVVLVMPEQPSDDEVGSYITRLLRWACDADQVRNGSGRPHLIIVYTRWIGLNYDLGDPDSLSAAFMSFVARRIPLASIDEDILEHFGHRMFPISSTDLLLSRSYTTVRIVPLVNIRQLSAAINSACEGYRHYPRGLGSWTADGLRKCL